jgi:adenylate cyclase
VGEATRSACPELSFRELDRVRVKGRSEPLAIYEPLGPRAAVSDSAREELERWHEALERFRGRDWHAAECILAELARAHPDAALYGLFRKRVARLRVDPPPAHWDGVTTFTEK